MAPVLLSIGRDRNAGKSGLRGCSATRPEAADFGRTLPVHAKGACEIRRGRGISELRHPRDFPGPTGYADPPFEAGFAFLWVRCRGLAKKGRTRGRFRAFREPA